MHSSLRDTLLVLGCFGILTAPVFVPPALAYDMSANSPAEQDPAYQATQPEAGRVPMHPYYTGYGEYVVNPLEMTNTRDNRGDIPPGGNSWVNYQEYRTQGDNWPSPCQRDPNTGINNCLQQE